MPRYLRYVGGAGLGVAVAFACRHVDLAAAGAVLRQTEWFPCVPLLVLALVARVLARARRTHLLVERRLAFRCVMRLTLAGCAAASVIPGPSEGVLWCTQLPRRHGFTLREIARFQIADKALVGTSIGLVALVLLPWWSAALITGAVGAVFALVARRLLAPLGCLVVSHVLSILMISLCLGAVGAELAPLACVQLFLATSCAGLLPLVPGQVGTFESAFAVVAVSHGSAPASALAACVLVHVADVVPSALVGLPALIRISRGERGAPHRRQSDARKVVCSTASPACWYARTAADASRPHESRRVLMGAFDRLRRAVSFRALVLGTIAAAAIVVFIRIAHEMLEGDMDRIDRAIALAIHGLDTPVLVSLMVVITNLGSGLVLAIVCALVSLWCLLRAARRLSLILVGTGVVVLALELILKHAFGRARPTLFPEIPLPLDSSFPSGHSMASMAVYGTVAVVLSALYPKHRFLAVVPATLLIAAIGFSRVFLGVHWPSDVIAGFTAGLPFVLVALYLSSSRPGPARP